MPRVSKLTKGGGAAHSAKKKPVGAVDGVAVLAGAVPAKKKRRRKLVKREIRRCQKTTELLTSKSAFERVVRETLQMFNPDMRLTPGAIDALRIAGENAVTEVMGRANEGAALIAGREGILLRDFKFAVGTFKHLQPY